MGKVNRPIRIGHIGQYGGGHIGQYAHSELGDSLLPYRRYGFSISPIWWQHIEDLTITYLYFEYCQSLFLRVFFKGIGLNESSVERIFSSL